MRVALVDPVWSILRLFHSDFVLFTGPSEKNLGLVKKTSQPVKKTRFTSEKTVFSLVN